jgi:hypothetical protein
MAGCLQKPGRRGVHYGLLASSSHLFADNPIGNPFILIPCYISMLRLSYINFLQR